MFNDLTKITKILTKKTMQQVLFYFRRSTVSINIFSCAKKLGQYKKSPREKKVKKKITFREIFCSMENFLELQCLV